MLVGRTGQAQKGGLHLKELTGSASMVLRVEFAVEDWGCLCVSGFRL